MQIEQIPEWALTTTQDAAIAALLMRGFKEDFDERSFHQQRHHLRLLAWEEDSLIGHMAMCYRDVRLDGYLTPICGLAEVVTAPEARGKGVATALLIEAIAFAKTTSATFFALFGDRPIYDAHGFVAQPNLVTYTCLDYAKTGQVKTDETTDLMVLNLSDTAWDGTAPLDLLGWKF